MCELNTGLAIAVYVLACAAFIILWTSVGLNSSCRELRRDRDSWREDYSTLLDETEDLRQVLSALDRMNCALDSIDPVPLTSSRCSPR